MREAFPPRLGSFHMKVKCALIGCNINYVSFHIQFEILTCLVSRNHRDFLSLRLAQFKDDFLNSSCKWY